VRHGGPAPSRSPGPVGLSVMAHDAELSLGDLAYLMMSISDNAATDAIIARVGLERVNATLRGLGLERTVVTGGCADIVRAMAEAVGVAGWEELAPRMGSAEAQRQMAASRALDPARATRSTPREWTRLLRVVWRDEAGPPQVREGVAWLMAHQVGQARMAGAFPFPPWVGSKGGSLASVVRNVAGVVDYLDGRRRFAVAVFTRGQPGAAGMPRGAVDRAIGEVAHLAVEHLEAAG
jgi:beta-lactamase class A